MFNGRIEHQSFVALAAALCIVGAALITAALFLLQLSLEACYSPIVLGGVGAIFLLGGLGVGTYVRYRMTR